MIKRSVFIILLLFAIFAIPAQALSDTELIETAIGETYFQEYDMYEDSFPGDIYFYCNVRNGDITEGPVKFDFPAGVTVVIQKDGTEVTFPNRQLIKETGSYSMTITSNEYVGYFRFRIQNRSVQATSEPESPTETYPEPELPVEPAEDPWTVLSPEITSPPVITDIPAQADNLPDYLPDSLVADVNAVTEMSESYDSERGMFLYTLLPDISIACSVPNGMMTNGAVRFEVPEDVVMTVTRDDEPIELPENTQFWEAGVYRCTFSSESSAFTRAYSEPPELVFRILPQYTNSLLMYYPPVGFSITSVKRNEMVAEFTPERVLFAGDGKYEVEIINDERLSFTFVFTLDTVPPVFALSNVDGGRSTAPEVEVSYISEDIEEVEFIKDRITLEKFNRNAISDAGSYVINVTDKAGNLSSVRFEMGYKMNGAAILAIITIALLIGAVCFVFYFIKRKTVVS